jgi:succinate dehydrogenase (ubiquinone) cytochrome b560 subunit
MDSRQALDLLNEQRAKRPSSPWHIYQPQLTSVSSIANRATGAGLSVGASPFF